MNCHSYSPGHFFSFKFHTFLTLNPKKSAYEIHSLVYDYRLRRITFSVGWQKILEFNKGARKHPHIADKTVATSTKQWLSWERFVTAGWQSCFSTYKSSLIIRSKEKWPGAERGRGSLGLLPGSTCYYLCICLGCHCKCTKILFSSSLLIHNIPTPPRRELCYHGGIL